MIRQVIPLLHRFQPHLPIEYIATREVKHCKRELFSWIVFNVDAVVQSILKLADTHVRLATFSVSVARHRQVICQKCLFSQPFHQLGQQQALKLAIFASDEDIHIAASGLPPAVGAADLNVVEVGAANYFVESVSDDFEHQIDLFARNPDLQVFQIFQPYLLIFRQGVGVSLHLLSQLLDRLDAFLIQLFGLRCSDAPDPGQGLRSDILVCSLQFLQLRNRPSLHQFFDLVHNLPPDVLVVDESFDILFCLQLSVERLHGSNCSGVGYFAALVSLVGIDLVEFAELFDYGFVEGSTILFSNIFLADLDLFPRWLLTLILPNVFRFSPFLRPTFLTLFLVLQPIAVGWQHFPIQCAVNHIVVVDCFFVLDIYGQQFSDFFGIEVGLTEQIVCFVCFGKGDGEALNNLVRASLVGNIVFEIFEGGGSDAVLEDGEPELGEESLVAWPH